MLLIAEKKEDKMKLRQNKNEEIDLRTIADMELGNQINSMLPLDGSKKMTGVLETVGSSGNQIKMGASGIEYNLTGEGNGIWQCVNCYYDGTVWRYSEDGKAAHLAIPNYDGMLYATAVEGLKDEPIEWIPEHILTNKTGVNKSGDTMTGGFRINGQLDIWNLFLRSETRTSELALNFNDTYGPNLSFLPTKNDFGNSFGFFMRNDLDLKNRYRFRENINGVSFDYNIYGEHNPPYTVGNYTGTGGSQNRIVEIGFSSAFAFIFPSLDMYDVTAGSSATNGFAVASDRNVSGKLYFYIAFKNM